MELVRMAEIRGTGINHCDTEEEFYGLCDELEGNPDFTSLGAYTSIQSIYEELNYQGFTDEQIEQFTHNRYGTCLEIVEYASDYEAFIGTR
jgi:hypothetical protein